MIDKNSDSSAQRSTQQSRIRRNDERAGIESTKWKFIQSVSAVRSLGIHGLVTDALGQESVEQVARLLRIVAEPVREALDKHGRGA